MSLLDSVQKSIRKKCSLYRDPSPAMTGRHPTRSPTITRPGLYWELWKTPDSERSLNSGFGNALSLLRVEAPMPTRSADPKVAEPNDNELDLPQSEVRPRSNSVITAETKSFLTSANRTFSVTEPSQNPHHHRVRCTLQSKQRPCQFSAYPTSWRPS